MIKRCFAFFCMLFLCIHSFSQSGFYLPQAAQTKIKFQLIDNLIIIPVEINGVALSFLLDTGVSKPILFNIFNASDSLELKHVESIYLRGLGDKGYIEALKSGKNRFKIGDAISVNQDVYIISDESINFTPRLGISVHGIIGYDVFKDFIVEINYGSKFIRLNNPESFSYRKCRKCQTLNLTLVDNKPFIDAIIEVNDKNFPVKLLMDSGGSDALWLFENDSLGLIPEYDKYFSDFLGKGLSGSVHGKRSKLTRFSLGDFHLKNVNVAYPDSAAVSFARKFKERGGSMGGELLKRFNIILDYKNEKVTVKKNNYFKDPFEYNKSGIVIEQDGVRVIKEIDYASKIKNDRYNESFLHQSTVKETYAFILKPAFRIVELRTDSPAETVGLKVGDVILSINNKDIQNLKMQEVNTLFKAEDGKLIKLKIERDGVMMRFNFRLESLL